ncbi:hypothetical protein MGU_10700 [Metarhizium guizhouense ARSEF 977]|uniref:Rhodopsin domain-containing protein n=1 Tax=Metarhizium guizhouense (strain ARSEF 977) TaxID=1276136 RepID=A0A0B4GHM7_METGA|nr:hypothetical protein MGU_10700 [Metarhizium guizhouense ARSEF 977]
MSAPTDGTELPTGSLDDRSPPLVALCIAMIVVISVMIVLRFASRLIAESSPGHFKSLWWDDWTALVSTIFMLVQLVMSLVMFDLGAGKHIWVVPPENVVKILRMLFAVYFIYDIHLAMAKASALFFLARIFPPKASPPWFNNAVIITHAANAAWFIGIVLGTIFRCKSLRNWNPMLPGKCTDASVLFMGSAIPSVVIDLAILLIPMPKIWGLKMTPSRKMAVIGIFTLGYCSIVVSLGRLVTVIKMGDDIPRDITYEAAPTFYWFTIETPAILISICIPAILSLCRFLDALYFKPLASKISSAWSSQSRGTLMTEQYDNAVSSRMASSKSKYVTDFELNTSAPNESQSRICLPSQQHGHHSVEVTGWEMQGQPPRRQSTNDAIRVQQDVEVRASPW